MKKYSGRGYPISGALISFTRTNHSNKNCIKKTICFYLYGECGSYIYFWWIVRRLTRNLPLTPAITSSTATKLCHNILILTTCTDLIIYMPIPERDTTRVWERDKEIGAGETSTTRKCKLPTDQTPRLRNCKKPTRPSSLPTLGPKPLDRSWPTAQWFTLLNKVFRKKVKNTKRNWLKKGDKKGNRLVGVTEFPLHIALKYYPTYNFLYQNKNVCKKTMQWAGILIDILLFAQYTLCNKSKMEDLVLNCVMKLVT